MTTRHTFLPLLLLALAACGKTPSQNENQLFTANARAEGSPNVDVIVTEIERKGRTSIVDVQFNYGPSVASSVFIACSFAKLAKVRGYRYTVQVEDFGKEGRYLVGFIPSPSKEAITALGAEFKKHDSSQAVDNEIFEPICQGS
jgi:hypothetical protein